MINVALYCRTPWQGLDWIQTHAGVELRKLGVFKDKMWVNLGDLRVYIIVPETEIEYLAGIQISLLHFLDPMVPIEKRNYLYSRLRHLEVRT